MVCCLHGEERRVPERREAGINGTGRFELPRVSLQGWKWLKVSVGIEKPSRAVRNPWNPESSVLGRLPLGGEGLHHCPPRGAWAPVYVFQEGAGRGDAGGGPVPVEDAEKVVWVRPHGWATPASLQDEA